MAKDIKEVIKDFVSFDIENNYYQTEEKDDMVRNFKKIVYEDEKTVREFLKEFFMKTKELATECDLIANEDETEEKADDATETGETEDTDETEETPEEPEASEESPEPEAKNESIKHYYIKRASDYLYE
jgi:hypothetical protein